MEMVLSNRFLNMNPKELGNVNGGAMNGMQIMYVSPDTSASAQLYLPIGVSVIKWAMATAMSTFQK